MKPFKYCIRYAIFKSQFKNVFKTFDIKRCYLKKVLPVHLDISRARDDHFHLKKSSYKYNTGYS